MGKREYGYSDVKCPNCGKIGFWKKKKHRRIDPDIYECTVCNNTRAQDWLDERVEKLYLREAEEISGKNNNSSEN